MTFETKLISTKQWRTIDKLIGQVMREPYVADILPHIQVNKGRIHEFARATDLLDYDEGINFNYEQRNTLNRKWDSAKLCHLTLPVTIDHIDIDMSSSDGVQSLVVQAESNVRGKMFELIEGLIFHGCTKVGNLGLTNFTGINTSAASAVFTTAGSFLADLEIAISSIRSAHILPPYTLIMTPGIRPTLRANDITAGAGGYKSEWEQFKEDYMNDSDKGFVPMIDKVEETDRLVRTSDGSVTLSNTNQAFLLLKNNLDVAYIAETYPLQREEIPNKMWKSDLEYALKYAATVALKNPDGVYFVSAATTNNAY